MDNYSKIIENLVNREADVEGDFVPPSRESASTMLQLLNSLDSVIPVSSICDDGDGGSEAYWMGPERHVQLNVPRDPKQGTTIFWSGEGGYELESMTEISQLDERLTWFQEGTGVK